MPTNRKRVVRTNKGKLARTVTPAYREELRAKDFLGELTESEAQLAKSLNFYCWDSHMKNERKIENTGHHGRLDKSKQKNINRRI
ncbi:MAG: hypothetical protein PHU49_03650 [Syntrophorhabdaceae bacterium]|nr:hypothetical protein [Syntrophorhabdaceae bacterium]MDD5243090.1 hypothetical protein [Syntrophorhabdaceae bacterium]